MNISSNLLYIPTSSFNIMKANKNGDRIPFVVRETVDFLRKHLDEEGLFRKSGNFERIRQVQNLYNQGQPVVYEEYECHVATCVLKAFFRELPESILSSSIFNEIISLNALDLADKVEVAKDLINAKLPDSNYVILKFLVEFLSEVAQHSEKNKMDAKNLSYVFGPNFLRAPNGIEFSLLDIERINNFVELLIRFHPEIFTKQVV